MYRKTKKKIADLIRKRKEMRIAAALLVIGMICLLSGVWNLTEVHTAQSSPVVLYGTVEDSAAADKIAGLGNVKNVSMYEKGVVTLQYGEYAGEFVLYGMEQEYLDWQYGNRILLDMQGEMPYVLLESTVIESLKNASGERIDTEKDYSLETVTIAGQGMARICGIIPAEGNDSGPCIYTNLQGFEKLAALNGEAGLAGETQNTGESLDSGDGAAEKSCVILTESGRNLDGLIQEIQKNGAYIEITQEMQQLIYEWNEKKLSGQNRFLTGCVFVLCACIVFYNRILLWKRDHLVFVQWLSNLDEKNMRQVFWYCWMGFVRNGVLSGGIAFFIIWVFFGSF